MGRLGCHTLHVTGLKPLERLDPGQGTREATGSSAVLLEEDIREGARVDELCGGPGRAEANGQALAQEAPRACAG